MCKLLNSSDFQRCSRNYAENFEVFKKNLKNQNKILKNLWFWFLKQTILRERPLLKIETDIHLESKKFLFSKSTLGIDYFKPP